ncbi:hemolysin family protein [Cohnella lupini]|uniref:CBS domain containing-hemolysin-like protein n=1 Tax=Cohnella lupini TaxID=1294267 RepID=A0A3D9IQU8_9BACL|nr:hemolysin family protein [Cohnella lupini]RED64160.1 CBS domain containing-hemolysin-like protein [Cohnella lupini]
MDGDPIPLSVDLVLIFALVFLNGFFVAAEFAMVKARGSRIDTMVQEGHKKAKVASHLMDHLDAYLSACQLGITLTSLGLGWIGEPTIARLLEPAFTAMNLSDNLVHPLSFIIGFTFITMIHIVFGELAPKSVAIRKAEMVTLWTATPLIYFRKVMSPFIWVLNGMAGLVMKPFGIDTSEVSSSAHTEEEIRILVKESHKSGLIDKTELTLMDNIFEFAETNAREIMIPRTEMSCLYGNLSFEENKSIALREMHTRYPVCEKDKDNIIGFVHIKDLLKVPDNSIHDIRDLMRPMTTVPESMPISTLLKLMQKRKSQIAILIDEYGGTSGLVTLEDIMEEIVGEIQDEFDEERPDVEKRDDNTYSINGMMLIEEVNSFFGLDISTDDYDTIGGWIYSQIENPPKKNQYVVSEEGFKFTIEETDHLRISRIAVTRSDHESWEAQAETG